MANSSSEQSPQTLTNRLYELLSGPPEEPRNWDGVRELFLPEARLYSELIFPDGKTQSAQWTVDEFVEAARREYSKDGLWESEIGCRSEELGNIAHVWSTYESRIGSPDAPPVVRGINSVQFLKREDTWRITSLVFQIERGAVQIPAHYLTAVEPTATPARQDGSHRGGPEET